MSYERDEDFRNFIRKFGEATYHQAVPAASIEKYRGVLPDELLTYWQEEGWNGYMDGLFWIVNPELYDELLDLWIADTPYADIDEYHVIARSGFGELYVWGQHNNQCFVINPSYMNPPYFSNSAYKLRQKAKSWSIQSFFFSRNPKHMDIDDEQEKPLYTRAVEKLGALGPDEMYGFVPAIMLGGRYELDNLEKVNLFMHLDMLARLTDERDIPDLHEMPVPPIP